MPGRTIRAVIAAQALVTATPKSTIEAAARLMRDKGIGALPVVEANRLVGIFTERDALFRVLAAERDPRRTRLADVLTPAPRTIHPDKPLQYALVMMHEGGFRHVPVVEDGRLLGMISAHDALESELDELGAHLLEREHLARLL